MCDDLWVNVYITLSNENAGRNADGRAQLIVHTEMSSWNYILIKILDFDNLYIKMCFKAFITKIFWKKKFPAKNFVLVLELATEWLWESSRILSENLSGWNTGAILEYIFPSPKFDFSIDLLCEKSLWT